MTKTNSKSITTKVKVETRGRPAAIIKYPKTGIFTAKTLHLKHPGYTLVTIQKSIKRDRENNIITLIDKKIVDKTGRGRPLLYYKFGKVKNVKISFVPKKPGKVYIPKYLKVNKIKSIEESPRGQSTQELIFIDKQDSKYKNKELDTDFAPAELDLVGVL
jgi:hypothetical protein